MGWSRQFSEPIPPPNGKKLTTLRDTALYITKLPKAEHDAAEWQAAMALRRPPRWSVFTSFTKPVPKFTSQSLYVDSVSKSYIESRPIRRLIAVVGY
jgi:hypothetical protein